MASCAAPGCTNNNKNCVLSFFRLPKNDKSLKDAWIARININKLPIEVYLCESHFDSECFDKSADLKRQLMPAGKIFFFKLEKGYKYNSTAVVFVKFIILSLFIFILQAQRDYLENLFQDLSRLFFRTNQLNLLELLLRNWNRKG